MLAVAEHWLRAELEENRLNRKKEQAAKAYEQMPTDRCQGGYSSGRFQTDEEEKEKLKKQGRRSDVMGVGGAMAKVHRAGY